nr:MAG TPA: hypothetical protein [Bacteriophage sp.]
MVVTPRRKSKRNLCSAKLSQIIESRVLAVYPLYAANL